MPDELNLRRETIPEGEMTMVKIAKGFQVATATAGEFFTKTPDAVIVTLFPLKGSGELSLPLMRREHCDALIAAIAECRDDVFPEGGDAT